MFLGFLIGAVATSAIGWAVAYFAPGLLARLFPRGPVRVHVEVDPARMYAGAPPWVGSRYVFREGTAIEEVGMPPTSDCREWRDWAHARGACDGDRTEIRVTIQGLAESVVLIDGLKVATVSREQPSGLAIRCEVGGADITPRHLTVDLDWDPAVVTFADGGGDPSLPFTFTLGRSEVEIFHIVARSSTVRCQWIAELLLIVDGRRQVFRVSDEGRPFSTCATTGLTSYGWNRDQWIPRESE